MPLMGQVSNLSALRQHGFRVLTVVTRHLSPRAMSGYKEKVFHRLGFFVPSYWNVNSDRTESKAEVTFVVCPQPGHPDK